MFVDSDDEYIANMHDGNEYAGHECAGPARFPIADRGPNAYPEVEYAFPDNESTAADADEFEVVSREDRSVRRIDDPIFKFGQYRAHTYRDVAEHDAGYFFWAKKQKKPSLYLTNFITWVEDNYYSDETYLTLTSRVDSSVHPGLPIGDIVKPKRATRQEIFRKAAILASHAPCERCTDFDFGGSNQF